jgi:hypothetical protein
MFYGREPKPGPLARIFTMSVDPSERHVGCEADTCPHCGTIRGPVFDGYEQIIDDVAKDHPARPGRAKKKKKVPQTVWASEDSEAKTDPQRS